MATTGRRAPAVGPTAAPTTASASNYGTSPTNILIDGVTHPRRPVLRPRPVPHRGSGDLRRHERHRAQLQVLRQLDLRHLPAGQRAARSRGDAGEQLVRGSGRHDGPANGSAVAFSGVNSNVTIRNNSFNARDLARRQRAQPDVHNFVMRGNMGVLPWNGCALRGISFSNNVWQGHACATTDRNLGGGALPYRNAANSSALDYHLTGGPRSTGSRSAPCRPTDIDGQARPMGARQRRRLGRDGGARRRRRRPRRPRRCDSDRDAVADADPTPTPTPPTPTADADRRLRPPSPTAPTATPTPVPAGRLFMSPTGWIRRRARRRRRVGRWRGRIVWRRRGDGGAGGRVLCGFELAVGCDEDVVDGCGVRAGGGGGGDDSGTLQSCVAIWSCVGCASRTRCSSMRALRT